MIARMRALFISIAAAFLLAAPAHAASGAYESAEAASANTCAQRCAADGLCMMWVYRTANLCELRAGVSQNLEALAAGVSPHAPQYARAMNIVVVAPVAAAQPPAPPPRRPHHHVALLGAPDTDRNGLRARIGGD